MAVQPGSRDPLLQILIQVVMTGQLCDLAALLMQPHPAPSVLHVKIFNLHPCCGTDTSEGVAHQSDQRPIAQPEQRADINRSQQVMHFVGIEDRGLPFLDAMLWSTDRMCGVRGDDLAGNQPIEEHADGGQVLLDGLLRADVAELLDIAGDVHRRDGR